MSEKSEDLKNIYESIALSLDYNTTASDYNLRELEIDSALENIKKGDAVLDVGCGLGYAVTKYALSNRPKSVIGIDYAKNMIVGANELLTKNYRQLSGCVKFIEASVLELPFEDNTFDVITSSRCLMALLDWDLQKAALLELKRVLKPSGVLVLMEGTFEGLEKLNVLRDKFNLELIEADGRDRLHTLKFHENDLLTHCEPHYELIKTKRFGMYYFITRIIHPLLVAPEKPKYSNKINEIAREIARVIPDYEGVGHLVCFVLKKREM
jgi:ubiquinone/menaquinone biosynthesis C-methylase UbiE